MENIIMLILGVLISVVGIVNIKAISAQFILTIGEE